MMYPDAMMVLCSLCFHVGADNLPTIKGRSSQSHSQSSHSLSLIELDAFFHVVHDLIEPERK